jgi:hypothetical protein
MRNIVRDYRETKAAVTWALGQAKIKYDRLRYLNPPVFLRHMNVRPEEGRFDTATTYEIEYPYRPGTSAVLRLFGGHALQLGILDSHPDLSDDAIDKRLLAAIKSADGGRSYWDTPEARESWARRTVGTYANGPDDEIHLLQQLGMWNLEGTSGESS